MKLWIITLWVMLGSTLAADDTVDYESLFGTSPRRKLDFLELTAYDGYTSEEHYVTTSDGYILGLFHIPIQNNCTDNSSKYPIIFMHGLFLSGDDCIIAGPKKAHCYAYADQCYDVWIPNNRGNRYSRNHTTYDPDKDSDFWDFYLEDIALKDLPAVIDYVLNETGKSKVTYVAHSQGVTLLVLLCSEQPAYNNKINVAFSLSTVAWLSHARLVVIKFEGVLATILGITQIDTVKAEILRYGGLTQKTADLLCGSSELSYPFCSAIIFLLLGYNKFQITDDVLPVIVGHQPAGISVKNFVYWGQVSNNGFARYDNGVIGNLKAYGRITPPAYDFSAFNITMKFIGSENDYVGDLTDLEILRENLPINTTLCVLSDKTFGHLDFIYGKDIPTYITSPILSYLETGTFTCV